MSSEWTIDEVLERCPQIDRNAVIDVLLSEASSSADLRRFLIAFAYAERRKQQQWCSDGQPAQPASDLSDEN